MCLFQFLFQKKSSITKYYVQGLSHNQNCIRYLWVLVILCPIIKLLENACPIIQLNLPTTSSPAIVKAFFDGKVKSLMNWSRIY